ncbi:hypothetical protein SNE40_006660 [Patella caerulea]|uniref:Glycosyltransferase family 92 protein n=2 Tax=Patella caerulea TaxID=87958 RepID=A0AAN8JWE3_PATCE
MMVTCPLKDNYNWNAVAVSISVNDTPLNYMVLHYPEKQIKRNFTICLSVMHSKYSKVLELIETFEFDKALGANHFVLYHRSSAKQSNVVLNHYIKSGELTLLNYTLPIPPKGIHYFGQIAAVNDCVYRSRGISRYVLVVDIDEILIPYQFNNWMSMMDNLTASNPNASAFMFRNTFFDTSMPDDIRRFRLGDKATRYKLKKFLKVWREDFIFGYCNRCKTLVMPEWIDKMAIHRTERIKGDHTPLRVNKSVALLHHYRRYGSSQARVFNAQTRKYSGIVVGRVIKTYEKLKPCVPDL